MRILAIGDVTDARAAAYLAAHLWQVRKDHHIDFTLVNAENAGFIIGPEPDVALSLLDGGADVLTGGNHTLQRKGLHALLDSDRRLIRPVNYPPEAPGAGYTLLSGGGYRILVINAIGQGEMDPADCPFRAVDRVLERESGRYDCAILDFHAELSGEKVAMGRYLDGRVHIVYGTHTHVPTADMRILPGGTGYVTDLGMCGPTDGVLGIDSATILHRFLTHLPEKYVPATGDIHADGVIFTFDPGAHRVTEIERIVL